MSTSKRFGRLSHPIMKGSPSLARDRRRAQKKRAQNLRDSGKLDRRGQMID